MTRSATPERVELPVSEMQAKALTLTEVLRADLERLGHGTGAGAAVRMILTERDFRVVLSFRVGTAAANRSLVIRLVCRYIHTLASSLSGVCLPIGTKIGPGLRIFHGRGLVVNAASRIGANVSLFGGVTIGRRDHIEEDESRTELGAPEIFDDVWVGPNAIIVGPVTIGRGARIAGGSVVFRDVEAACIVGGNPAIVLRQTAPPDVLHRAKLPIHASTGDASSE